MFSILTILIVCALSVAAGFSVYLSARPVTTPYAHSVDERVERDAAALATRKRHSQRATTLALSAVIVAVAGVILNPYVRVWTYSMDGQAQMAQAESSRQIKVREAQATRDAALLLAAEYGSVKDVANRFGVNATYLQRLADDSKASPSEELLMKLGLQRIPLYVRKI